MKAGETCALQKNPRRPTHDIEVVPRLSLELGDGAMGDGTDSDASQGVLVSVSASALDRFEAHRGLATTADLGESGTSHAATPVA